MVRRTRLLAIWLLIASAATPAQVPEIATVATVPSPGPHWIWADDLSFFNMVDGRAYLIDADDGRMIGMLSTGTMFTQLVFPRDYSVIYANETYYSRGSRGERTDLITYYDPHTLAPTGEVIIPPHRQTGIPVPALSALTDDDRFLLIYNFNPAQSVTVVDVRARKVAAEIATPGCALVYPAAPRRFAMLCQDGSLLGVTLGEEGTEAKRAKSEPFFDPQGDPITEKAVRLGQHWLFASFDGKLYDVDMSREQPSFAPPWPLVGAEDRAASWKIGGAQHLALHTASGRLYSLMHRGGVDTHKDPGAEVWVYDLAKRARTQRIVLEHPAITVQVTQDDAPVMLATAAESAIDVYDARTGAFRHTIEGIGQSPWLIQTIPLAARPR